jgi:hypothetical protein
VRPLLSRIERARTLPAADRMLLSKAYLALLGVDLSLRLFGFQRLLERQQRRVSLGPDTLTEGALSRAWRYAFWIDVAARHHMVRARCLHRALALNGWLRREGLPSTLRIGVRKAEGQLKAHAWVQLAGRTIYERDDALTMFTPMAGSARSPHMRDVLAAGTAWAK